MIFQEGNKLYSIFSNKCPRCHKGDFWLSSNPYTNLFRKAEMHERCSCCDLKYERETGYWYGAMYVSYALSVAIFVGVWLFSYLTLSTDTSMWIYVWIVLGANFLLFPVNFYLSRLIWINFFIRYEKMECKKV